MGARIDFTSGMCRVLLPELSEAVFPARSEPVVPHPLVPHSPALDTIKEEGDGVFTAFETDTKRKSTERVQLELLKSVTLPPHSLLFFPVSIAMPAFDLPRDILIEKTTCPVPGLQWGSLLTVGNDGSCLLPVISCRDGRF